jgi:hypothetical protein
VGAVQVWGDRAQVKTASDTLFFVKIDAAGASTAQDASSRVMSRTTATWRPEMRPLYLGLILLVVAGLVYFIALGLAHR